jgi:hypothetical protein
MDDTFLVTVFLVFYEPSQTFLGMPKQVSYQNDAY